MRCRRGRAVAPDNWRSQYVGRHDRGTFAAHGPLRRRASEERGPVVARPSNYPEEFRREAVQIALATEDSRASVARLLGVNETTLCNRWPTT